MIHCNQARALVANPKKTLRMKLSMLSLSRSTGRNVFDPFLTFNKINCLKQSQEDSGLSLRVGDKLVAVNGKPVGEMWESTIEKGILKLTFDEKRKKRKTRLEMLIPRATCAISRLGKEGQENIYLWPDTERTQKLLKSSGAVVTINSILSKMEALDASRDRISQHSRTGLSNVLCIAKNV